MSDEEIKKYALQVFPKEPNEDIGQMEFLRDTFVRNASKFLDLLSKDYCIVPKNKVLSEYDDAIAEGKHAHVKHQIQSRTRIKELEYIFGKTMFEQKGE